MAGELFCADQGTGAIRVSFNWPLGGLIAADAAGTIVGDFNGVSSYGSTLAAIRSWTGKRAGEALGGTFSVDECGGRPAAGPE